MAIDPTWIAQRHGQNWNCEETLAAIDWLTSFVDHHSWSRRIDTVKKNFEAKKKDWAETITSPLFDPQDAIAWYVFQANAYGRATARHDFFEPQAFRIAPVFLRLGQVLTELRKIRGIDARIAQLMTKDGRSQPDQGMYELLVAAAYKCRGWSTVEFVPEQRGNAKTHEFNVTKGQTSWAVECKRTNRSGYEASEFERGLALAKPVHDLCKEMTYSLVLEVIYLQELKAVADDYLTKKVAAFLEDSKQCNWEDEFTRGRVRKVNWKIAHSVLAHDDVFFGSSRMIELLVGYYLSKVDHSVAADWIPGTRRPLHAAWVSQASVVSWRSASEEAARCKARHFKSLVARAELQLPHDRPGVVHIGYEEYGGNSVDPLRHLLNRRAIREIEPRKSQLRLVYGNYMSPEHTNDPNESCALSETTATYKVGKHSGGGPLADHMLFCFDDGERGAHW